MPFPDSRRLGPLTGTVPGLVIANHAHLSKVARAVSSGRGDVHPVGKGFSKQLDSDRWDVSSLSDRLVADAVAEDNDNGLLVADVTEVRAGQAPGAGLPRLRGLRPGGRRQPFPLRLEPLTTHAETAAGENEEAVRHAPAGHRAAAPARSRGCWTGASLPATCPHLWS
jgi:hypothetical protein